MAKDNQLLENSTILNYEKYIIQNSIRSSNLSNVYDIIESPSLNRSLILKESLITETKSKQAFVDEIATVIKVSQIFSQMSNFYIDSFPRDNPRFLVMRKIEGITLDMYVKQNKITNSNFKKLILSLLQFVNVLHKNNILHGDIGPDNIIVCDNKKLVLIDYGNACINHNLRLFQKSSFSAPELYDEKHGSIGKWSDIYSLGATMYFMLQGDTLPESIKRINDNIQLSKNRKCYQKVIKRCTSLDIKNRPHTICYVYFLLHFKIIRNILLLIILIVFLVSSYYNGDIRFNNEQVYSDTMANEQSYKDPIYSEAETNNGYENPSNNSDQSSSEEIYSETEADNTIDVADSLYYSIENGEIIIEGSVPAITEITIPSSINGIPVSTIKSININVTNIDILEGMHTIEQYAFQNCQYLKTIKIPASVKVIDEDAFINCGALERIDIASDNPNYYVANNQLLSKADNQVIVDYN